MTIGTCKHGDFDLMEGCPQCIEEKRTAELAEQVKAKLEGEDVVVAEATIAEVRPAICQNCATWAECQGSNQDDCSRPESTAVALRQGEDTEASNYYAEGKKALEYAKNRVIATLKDNQDASNDLILIKKLRVNMEAKRKDYLDPLKIKSDAIRAAYTEMMAPILEAKKITEDKMLAYDAEQMRIRAEQEEVNRLRLEAAQKEAALAGTGEITESVNLVEVMSAPARNISTDLGTSGKKARWTYEIIDVNLIPREYMMPDTSMLTRTAQTHHDKKPVPGIRFFNDPIIASRARQV